MGWTEAPHVEPTAAQRSKLAGLSGSVPVLILRVLATTPGLPVPLTSLDHYLIFAEDLEATKDFYVNILGMQVGERPPFPFPGYWVYLGDAACVHLAHAGANQAQKDYLGDESRDASHGTGPIDHIAFAATGLEEMLARFESLGIGARRRTVPEQGQHQVFITDPNGITIELNYPDAERKALEERA